MFDVPRLVTVRSNGEEIGTVDALFLMTLDSGTEPGSFTLAGRASMNPDKIPETAAVRRLRRFLESQGRKQGRAEGEVKGRTEGEAKGRTEGRAEGEAKGRQEALLTLLKARGVSMSPQDLGRIRGCVDAAMLDRWIERAATADAMSSVLGPPAATTGPRRRRATRPRAASS